MGATTGGRLATTSLVRRYVCHADYGMFGTIVTKAGGMRHVWMYLTSIAARPWTTKVPDHEASLSDERMAA